ncbi:MAG: LacI family transcriptional regulator, partial [Clostridiales bacterium]|nr:LacI family transcriptional regulator [Clostridiales bacterium]
MATLKDVAKLAGVSATTVSIVINGKAEQRRISKETQDKVFKAVNQLNYKPNLNARKLRFKDGSKPYIAFYWPLDYCTSILAHLLNSMQKEIVKHNLEWDFVVQTYESDKLERDDSSFSNNVYNAAIIGGASFNDIKFLESINPSMPIVLINRESEIFSSVSTDNQDMGFQVAHLLKYKGYKDVTVISPSHSHVATSPCTQAFLYACSQLGINVQSNYIIKEISTMAGGARAAQVYCQMPDA